MKSVSFISGDYPVTNSPFIYNLSNYFNNNNVKVFIPHINTPLYTKLKSSKLKSILSKYKFLVLIYRVLLYDLKFINRVLSYSSKIKVTDEENVFAIEKFGLFLSFLNGIKPRLYVSLETNYIFHSETLTEFFLNIFEKIYLIFYRPPVMCTSSSRLNILTYNNKIKLKNTLIVPVCGTQLKITEKNAYIRSKYNIDEKKIIVLIAGTMGHSLVDEIVSNINMWPSEFVLFLHSSNGVYTDFILDASLNSKSIILSDELFTIEDAESKIYNSADISIIMYPDNSINYKLTAFSSGKLAASTKCGLPVLVPDFKEYRDLILDYKFGLTTNIFNIPTNLQLLNNSYSFFSSESKKAYQNIYNFENYKESIDNFLVNLSTSR